MVRVKNQKPTAVERFKGHVDAISAGVRELIDPGTLTVHSPKERRKFPDNFRGMILLDPQRCIHCFQCAFSCPSNAVIMKLGADKKYYPSIDYAKCIFCHFCVDSCPRAALYSSKIHDVAFKNRDELFVPTENMIEAPDIERDDETLVTYRFNGDRIILERTKEKDKLILPKPTEIPLRYFSYSAHPENCTGCGICAKKCPSDAITMVGDVKKKPVIDADKCTGCGICVSECPKKVLDLKER